MTALLLCADIDAVGEVHLRVALDPCSARRRIAIIEERGALVFMDGARRGACCSLESLARPRTQWGWQCFYALLCIRLREFVGKTDCEESEA